MADPRIYEHDLHQRVAVALSRTGFNDPGADPETLSGGWRARLALARAIQLTLRSGLRLLGISAPARLEREVE